MNRLKLLFVGEAKAPWAAEAGRHYQDALARYVRCETVNVRDVRDAKDAAARMRKEGQALLGAVTQRDMVIGLDEGGKAHGSKGLAARMTRWLEDPGRAPCFVVGGPFGFSPEMRARFDETMSLGPYTLPHDLARVVLLEQLYRAMTILAGHPYHHQ